MISKQKLFIDFDCTIVDSLKAYCKIYNKNYCTHENFKLADVSKVRKYNLIDECPLAINNVKDIFDSKEYFDSLEFMKSAEEVLKELSNKFNIIICSIGTLTNISQKAEWIKRNMPFVDNVILMSNDGVKMDKSIIDMEGSIHIDDVTSNLTSCNARIKICFGKEYDWNSDWDGVKCLTWDEVKNLLLNR